MRVIHFCAVCPSVRTEAPYDHYAASECTHRARLTGYFQAADRLPNILFRVEAKEQSVYFIVIAQFISTNSKFNEMLNIIDGILYLTH